MKKYKTHLPETEDLLNGDVEVKYYDKKIKDSRGQPWRLGIVRDARRAILAKKMLEANEKGEKVTYTQLAKEFDVRIVWCNMNWPC